MANQVLWGFRQLKDLFDERTTAVDIPVLNRAVAESVAEHNRQLNAILALFATPTTEYSERYLAANLLRNQPLDENGRPLPVKPAGYYDVAFPIRDSGQAWGANRVTRIKMTIGEVNRVTDDLLMGDSRWVRDQLLAALYTPTSYTFSDPLKGTLTVLPLANGDTQTYQILSGADAGTTDTHYLAQAAAISDAANPFPTIYSELTEHPENAGGKVIVLVPTNLKGAIQGLATFSEEQDPNLRYGTGLTLLVGMPDVEVPGTYIGYTDGCFIAEWTMMPDNYMIAVSTGGDRPLAMRQHREPELQGFVNATDEEQYPYFKSYWERRLGFGGRKRSGALVYRVGNSTYAAAPAGYTAPIP